jgi:hypothetical protein
MACSIDARAKPSGLRSANTTRVAEHRILRHQNRASLPVPPLVSVTQKLSPSLHAPNGTVPGPVPVLTKPSGVRSVAFHSETPGVTSESVTNMRSPSNAAHLGWLNPLPISVAKAEPVDARTQRQILFVRDRDVRLSRAEQGGLMQTADIVSGPPLAISGTNVVH